MKIAFIHYHLKTGGVSTVMRQQIEAVQDCCETLVLTGELPDRRFPADVEHIPELTYSDRYKVDVDPEHVAEKIYRAIHSKWHQGCDVVHVHNPTLAKNIHFLNILKALQGKNNQKLFLQIHDFAEDGRPHVYFHDAYPVDCHYGVINSRDYNFLLKSGLKKQGVHKIFNTIKPLETVPDAVMEKNSVLYPVRAIRRKNIGEAILLTQFFRNEETLNITQPPNSPMDIRCYSIWKQFVDECHLKVNFEVGLRHEFKELVGSSKFLLTTSINEGFGFSFLEPWTAGKLLWGRRLPYICHDFEQHGIRLNHLYTQLRIPVDWLGKNKLFTKWKHCVIKTCSDFSCTIASESIADHFKATIKDGTIDFGLLNETFQRMVIRRIRSSKSSHRQLITLNPFLSQPGKVPDETDLVHHNKQIVERNYTTERYRDTLMNIYATVVKHRIRHGIDKKKLMWLFFNLDNFSLLRWCDDA